MTMTWVFRALGASCMLSLVPAVVSAQSDFSTLRLEPGQVVYVTDTVTGTEISGPLTAIDRNRLVVGRHEIAPAAGLKIERDGDSLVNGTMIGAILGGLDGVTIAAEACLHRSAAICFGNGAVWGGLLGAFIDWRHRGRTTVLRIPRVDRRTSLRVLPVVDAHARGVAVTISRP